MEVHWDPKHSGRNVPEEDHRVCRDNIYLSDSGCHRSTNLAFQWTKGLSYAQWVIGSGWDL